MTGQLGRIQWSKLGITLYDVDGSFVCRIEDAQDRKFFTNFISIGLRELSKEQQRRNEATGEETEVAPV